MGLQNRFYLNVQGEQKHTKMQLFQKLFLLLTQMHNSVFFLHQIYVIWYFVNMYFMASCLGFVTTKGELVRSILFPPPLDFQFHRDFLKSIYVFLTLGLIGLAYSLTMWIQNGVRSIWISAYYSIM